MGAVTVFELGFTHSGHRNQVRATRL